MSPSAKRTHQRACGRLFRQLSDKLEAKGCTSCEAVFEVDWVVANDTVFRPDLLVVCNHKPSDFIEETPILVAEILSDSTRQRDLVHKRETYQELGVKYYLTIDPATGSVQLLLNGPDGYVDCKDARVKFHQDCEIELDWASLLEQNP